MKIVKVTEKLPKHNQYVLAFFPSAPWNDSDAINNEHKWVVVKHIKGFSKKTREALPDYIERKIIYQTGDEWGNNTVPYEWDTFGPGSFFGQEATLWCELPDRTHI